MQHFFHQLGYLDWWLLLRITVSILYWGSIFPVMLYYLSFYTTTHIRETRLVSFGEYEIEDKFVEKHTNPKKRKEEACVCVLYVVWAILLMVWWFSTTNFS